MVSFPMDGVITLVHILITLSIKTPSEMKDQATYTDWDFSTVWGISSNYQDGYPFLLGNIFLVMTAPIAGDAFVKPEDVTISWYGSAGSNPALDIYYSYNGTDYTLIASGVTSPYDWDFPDTTAYGVTIKLDLNGYEVVSGAFDIFAQPDIKILSPTSLGTFSAGGSLPISVQTAFIDSVQISWSTDSLSWTKLTTIQTDESTVDTAIYDWSPPNISGDFFIKAEQPIDTAITLPTLSLVGNPLSNDYAICWHYKGGSYVERFYELDQCCGWCSGLNLTAYTTLIKDKADGLYFHNPSILQRRIANYPLEFYIPTGVYIDGPQKTLSQFYTHGSHVTYKNRYYYFEPADSTVRCNDLINNIDGIFVVDLKPWISNFSNGYWHGWTGIPGTMQIYNVQRSKIQGGSFTSSYDFESLNDSDFVPQILIGGSAYGHGDLVMTFDALPRPQIITDHIKDVVRLSPNEHKRYYFRGIFPKATKHAKEPYKSTFPVE